MRFSTRLSVLLVVAGLALGTGSALAAPGIAAVNANVRSGPGTGYGVVDRLAKGEYVIVVSCGASWCNIHHIGRDGYVARTLLYNPYYGSRAYYQFAPKHPQPGRATSR